MKIHDLYIDCKWIKNIEDYFIRLIWMYLILNLDIKDEWF